MRKVGNRGEDLAAWYLQGKGLRLLFRNWVCRHVGELDLVMTQGEEIVFVEVKYRTSRSFGSPLDSFDGIKSERLFSTIEEFLLAHPRYQKMIWRLDLLAVRESRSLGKVFFDWYRGVS